MGDANAFVNKDGGACSPKEGRNAFAHRGCRDEGSSFTPLFDLASSSADMLRRSLDMFSRSIFAKPDTVHRGSGRRLQAFRAVHRVEMEGAFAAHRLEAGERGDPDGAEAERGGGNNRRRPLLDWR